MRIVKTGLSVLALVVMVIGFSRMALACRMSLDFSAKMATNAVEIDSEARLRLADTIIRARAWPDEVLASVVTPALANENKPEELAQARATSIKSYLLELGVKEENIVSDAKVRPKARQSKQEQDEFRELDIEFTPNCFGHCAELCEGTYSPPRQ